MSTIPAQPAHGGAPPAGLAVLALGFRPFFLVAGVAAVTFMVVWMITYGMGSLPQGHYAGVGWHSHEMLFGYTPAVIAGFLLTAVRNWTAQQTAQGLPLALLAVLWLAGRIAAALASVLPGWLIAVLDIAFLPTLALVLAVPLVRSAQRHNLLFVPILLLLAGANALVHAQALGLAQTGAARGNALAITVITLLITVIAGRVIPFFVESALPGVRPRRWPWVERLALATVVALAVLDVLGRPWEAVLGTLVAASAAGVHGLRLAGWHARQVWSVPILWVLFLGYGWLVLGLALRAGASAGLLAPSLADHAMTVGAIGVLTLGMMARVALGHTGRPMHAARLVVLAFVAINAAAVVRVVFPLLVPSWYPSLILAAGGLWVVAFLLFTVVYAPVLVKPRVDGRPG